MKKCTFFLIMIAGLASLAKAQIKGEVNRTHAGDSTQVDSGKKLVEDLTYQTQSGLPVAASKVYFTDSKFAVSGFGEINYIDYHGPIDRSSGDIELYNTNLYRFVSYLAYKPRPWLVLYTELFAELYQDLGQEESEFDHEIFIEAFVDFLLHNRLNIRAGTSQLHLGFINNNDEPVMFYSVNRPDVERIILPSTWIDLGVTVYGGLTKNLNYALGIFQGLDASHFNGGTWIRGGRDHAFRMNFDSYVLNGKLEYKGTKDTELAINGFWSKGTEQANSHTFLTSAYVRNSWGNWSFMALGAYGQMQNTDQLFSHIGRNEPNSNQVLGSQVYGYYLEAGYNIWPVIGLKKDGKSSSGNLLFDKKHLKLPLFARFERLDTHADIHPALREQDIFRSNLQTITIGANFYSSRNFVFKTNYQFRTNKALLTTGEKEGNRLEFGLGFIF